MAERITTKHDIQRDELNTIRPNFAEVTRVFVTGSIGMIYSGVDRGTGDVTLFVTGSNIWVAKTGDTMTGKLTIELDGAGRNELLKLWGGTTDPLSGPSIGFYNHYAGGAYPTFKVGEIAGTWAYPNGGDLIFYVNNNSDLVNGVMTEAMRMIGVSATQSNVYVPNGTLFANAAGTGVIKLVAKGAASQTANLQEWQDSTGTAKAYISKQGAFFSNPADDGAGSIAGVTVSYSHTSNDTGYGLNFNIAAINNGLTSGASLGVGFFGGASIQANTANSYNNAIHAGFIRNDFFATAPYTAKANISSALSIDAPVLTGAGTFVITNAYGVNIANQGNASTTNVYGIKIADQSGAATLNYAIHTSAGLVHFGDSVDLASGKNITLVAGNIITDTTTGTKIGTGTTQKLGFWNVTPIVQPTTGVAAATFAANTSGIVDDTATFDGYTIGQVVKALRNLGLLA